MRTFLILTQMIYVLAVFPWIMIFPLSFMAFDNGISTPAACFVLAIGIYPVALIVCSILAWIFYRKRRSKACIWVNLIPSLWIMAGLVFALSS